MSNKLYYRDKELWIMLRHQAVELLIYAGIAIVILFTIIEPNYQNLKQDTIMIQSINMIVSSHGSSTYVLETDKKQSFKVTVDEADALLQDMLKQGVKAKIKYFTAWPSHINYIREMTVEGDMLVTYHDGWKTSAATVVTAFVACGLLGAGFLWLGITSRISSHYNKQKTLEIKERARAKK